MPTAEVKATTCYMCACRCGIRVHLENGKLRYIDGNPDHPLNQGVICAKGPSGIMKQYSPARLRPISSLATAIGVKHPRIEQKAQGFMGGSFNTREFFHGRTRETVRAVRWALLVLVFPVPAVILGISGDNAFLLALAFALQYTGLLAERWYFFAEANHPQNLYYEAIS